MPKCVVKLSKVKKYKKVRLKRVSGASGASGASIAIALLLLLISCVSCNRSPRFLLEGQSEIVLRLREGSETPPGTLIYTVKGFDPDDDSLTFGILKGPDSDIIRIEASGPNEAKIILARELDRETKSDYNLVLTLTDNKLGDGNFVKQSLVILVEDINDNAPIFKPYHSTFEVPENSFPGIVTKLEATDADEGAYGQVLYLLKELDNDNSAFTVETRNGLGILKLREKLDYETKNLYQLRVLAIDRANQGPVNTGTASILVRVKDLEDQPPEFIQVQSVTRIPEDATPGTQVLRVKAIDGDRGVNNKIKYSIEKNMKSDIFAIEEDTGIVYTTKELDREDETDQVNGAYILTIRATEMSKLSLSPFVKTEVTIIITDVNDETPTFREEYYRCEVNENAQIHTPLTFIDDVRNEVYDRDVGNNGTFQLFLNPSNDMFEISPTLAVNEANFLIRVKDSKLLDYEKMSQVNFTVVAKEIANPGKWSSVNIEVTIRDQNDNFPEFTQHIYEVTIPENCEVGTTVVQVKAFDEDSGDFGTAGIRYTNISGGIAHLLNLDQVSGVVTVKQSGGSAFDRELISRHYLTIEARDNTGTGNRNTVQLIINISDVNDNAPVFLLSRYETKLIENKPQFETPLLLEARDVDLNDTENSDITYEIVDGHLRSNFTVDPKTGVISIKGIIDFEQLPGSVSSIRPIHLTVRARDSGMPIQTSMVPVTIYVQDANDNGPIFDQEFYSRTIPEDMEGGSSVLQVQASDNDGSTPNNLIVYRIQSGASDKFVISPDTGVISVANGASLDPDLSHPKKLYYTLTVIALDGGIGNQQLTSTALVNITIKDVNNKAPVFGGIENVAVRENTPVGTTVYRVLAYDLDDTPILRFHLDPQISEARTEEGTFVKQTEYDYMSAFELNPLDGVLKVVKLLDREKVELIKLGVVVEDKASAKGPQYASTTVNIIVEDENDNNPKFRKPFYKKSVPENSMNGVPIVNVVAYDVDKNKTITYSLEGNAQILELIHLDSETGEIVVANKIDHETYKWLNFTVRATDYGYPPRSSLVDVYISVLDENDNNPFFITSSKNFTVTENAPIGTRVGTVQAGDADSGDFGKITFLMDRISSQGKFSIDADTGVLSVTDQLDREIKDTYMLVIEAWDNYQFGYLAGESRNTFKQIFVNILDENDSPPELFLPTSCVQITEYHDPKEVIAVVKGKDADDHDSPNGQLEFGIAMGNDDGIFDIRQIDPWTAEIYSRFHLKNKYGNYTLTISARDLGTPSNIVKKPLEICISDFNDHPPVFISPSHNATIRVPENATIGTTIIQVHAVDGDIGPNAAVRYRLKPDQMGNYKSFVINEENGKIVLNKELDREKQKIYEIRVEAFDMGIPTSLSTDLDLTIYVRNVNEYEPQFLVEEISVNFTEHISPGVEKVKLPDTIDKDEVDELDDPPTTVCYYIVHGNENETFQLDPEEHILIVRKELDREAQSKHILFIRATENCLSSSSDPELAESIFQPLVVPLTTGPGGRRLSRYSMTEDPFDRHKHSRNLRSIDEGPKNSSHLYEDLLMEDSTIVRVAVYVQDINDNAPKFVSKIFTGGITTDADFGTEFMEIKAIDADEGINARVKYYQVGEIRRTLSEGLENIQKAPFLVDQDSGRIQLNFDPQKGMKGYFDFMVLANDTYGLEDVAHVFIYLLREDQKVRFVFRQQPPALRDKISLFRDTLSNVTDAIVNIDEFKVHENKDGSVDKTKTDLYLHLVDKRDNSIYEVTDVLKIIDEHIDKLDELFRDFNVLDTQPAEPQLLVAGIEKKPMMIWLIFSNLFLASLLVVTIIICASQRSNYKRQLRMARISVYNHANPDGADPATIVPNTNKHSVEGSNPVWLKAYENEWFKNDDDVSQAGGGDSLDENVLTTNDESYKPERLFDKQNDLNRHFNVYHHIDKLTSNVHNLTRKLETTEL